MQNIKLEDILKIIEQFESSSIDSLRYKTGDEEIELSRNKNGSVAPSNLQSMDAEQVKSLLKEAEEKTASNQSASTEQPVEEKEEQPGEEEQENMFTVTSPIIGTFYRAPAPGKPVYVKKGDKVKEGDTLCIIEAMKVMNKIESEVTGEVVEEIAEDGQTVEYGSKLFKIKLD
ncbi:MAG: acetyl-CoA carboxylase biotin carboxyl carrier protein [Bacteroidota bacterium]